jgi:hypothetical protein
MPPSNTSNKSGNANNPTNKETTAVTDTAPTSTATDAPAPTDALAADATTTAAPETPKRKKDPVPEGFLTLVDFAKHAGKAAGGDDNTIRPQVMYGYARNDKTFPFKQNTDGRYIINVEEGMAWMNAKAQRVAERKAKAEAKKAAEAAAAAAKPAETPANGAATATPAATPSA